MSEPKAKVCHYTDVPGQVFGDEAPGTTLRWIIDEHNDGAPVYALRMVEIEPGGHSPRHSHPYEHENFVVEGKGRVMIDGAWHDLKPGMSFSFPPAPIILTRTPGIPLSSSFAVSRFPVYVAKLNFSDHR